MSVTNADLKIISKIVEELTDGLRVDLKSEVSADLDAVKVNLKGKDSALLIGYHGDNLSAFSYLVNVLAKKKIDKDFKLKIDVGGYLEEKDRKIKNMILREVEKVKHSGFPEEVTGLNPYERRIAHMLVEKEGLMSESAGFGRERKLIIKPKKA